MDVSSTSSDSDTDYLTPLTEMRKEELLQKEKDLETKAKHSKQKMKKTKKKHHKSKRSRSRRYTQHYLFIRQNIYIIHLFCYKLIVVRHQVAIQKMIQMMSNQIKNHHFPKKVIGIKRLQKNTKRNLIHHQKRNQKNIRNINHRPVPNHQISKGLIFIISIIIFKKS